MPVVPGSGRGRSRSQKALKFEDFEIQEKDSAGYVSKFRIGNTVCSGDEFRDALSLASSAFPYRKNQEDSKSPQWEKGTDLG